MKYLQEQLLLYPLTNIIFHISLPSELVEYEDVVEDIPETFLENNSILYLDTMENCQKIVQPECMMRIIQDSRIKAILVASNHSFVMDEEILFLLQNEGIPFIQLTDKRSASLWIRSKQLQPNFISTELQRLQKKDLSVFLQQITTGIDVSFLYLDEDYQPLLEVGLTEEIKNLKQWLNLNLRRLVMKQDNFTTNDKEIINLYLAEKKEHYLLINKDIIGWKTNWIAKIANLLALTHHTNTLFSHVQTKQKEQFIIDLLFAQEESSSKMIKRGAELGWNLEHPHFLLILEKNIVKSNLAINSTVLLEWLGQWDNSIEEKIHVETYQDQVIIFIEDNPDQLIENKKKYIKDFCLNLSSSLTKAFPLITFQIGIGNYYESFKELHKSYQEAKLALKFGQFLNEEPKVYHINDLGMIRLLLYNHKEVLRDFSQDYLKEIIQSDHLHGTQYIKTLTSYIKYNGNITEVSNHLFIHPNTLRNRLKKMEEMTGIELSNLQQICHLIIALQIQTLLDFHPIS